MLDFNELPKDGNAFEMLVRELLIRRGLEVYWTGKGPDGGKDLVCIERVKGNFKTFEKRWIVQCKHNAHAKKAVSEKAVTNIIDICTSNSATGYLLACTTYVSSTLAERFREIDVNVQNNFSTAIWDCTTIEMELLKPQNWDIAMTFFPQSVLNSGWQISTMKPGMWFVSYGGYVFYLCERIANNYNHSIEDIEKCIKHINKKSEGLPDNVKYRLRAIYFDDKNMNYLVYLDLLIPEDISDEGTKKIQNVLSKVAWCGESIEGTWFDFDIRKIRYNGFSDRFDFDNQEYYQPYLSNFSTGSERKTDRVKIVNTEDQYILTEDDINKDFNNLVEGLKTFDFLTVLNSGNATLEKVNVFQQEAGNESYIKNEDISIGSFFNAVIRIQCDKKADSEMLYKLVERFPLSAMNIFHLTRDYLFDPVSGIERDDYVYNLSLSVNEAMYSNKQQYRKALNQFLRELLEIVEKAYAEYSEKGDIPFVSHM